MTMRLPPSPVDYVISTEQQRNLTIELADKQNHKKDQDVEIGAARLVLRAPNGTRWSVTVDNSGNLGTTAL
jgi:hypothetical protein